MLAATALGISSHVAPNDRVEASMPVPLPGALDHCRRAAPLGYRCHIAEMVHQPAFRNHARMLINSVSPALRRDRSTASGVISRQHVSRVRRSSRAFGAKAAYYEVLDIVSAYRLMQSVSIRTLVPAIRHFHS